MKLTESMQSKSEIVNNFIQLKYVCKLISGYSFSSESYTDEGIPTVRIGSFGSNRDNPEVYLPLEYLEMFSEFIVKKEDILVAMTGATVGKTALYKKDRPSLLNQRVALIRASKDNTQKYVYYCLQNESFLTYITNSTFGGAQGNISLNQIGAYRLNFPKLATQASISDYLDKETAKIDNLISKQENLLKLLEEKRHATVTRYITRGLNSDIKFIESDIKWLGKIPFNWKLYRTKFIFRRVQVKPLDSDEVVTAFRDGEVVLRNLRRTEGFTFADKEIGYQHVAKGDLVIHAMDGFAGAIGVSKSNGKMSPVCSICRPIDISQVNTEYFAQLVRTMAKSDWLTAIAKGIRERSTDFRWNDFANMEFPLPPYEEQVEIMEVINNESLKVDILKEKVLSQIVLLKERRISLISNVVTGKVKI